MNADAMEFGPDLLATNFVPDKTMASTLCATIVQQEEQLKRIDETIHGLETRIQELRAQKEPIQHSNDVNRALVASERKLPPEMLSEVFEDCLAGSNDPSYHETQLLLMQVCRRWRRIAASTPSLWTSLILKHEPRSNPCKIISMGLTNSGALPMTASIDSNFFHHQALRLLAENLHRFRHFVGHGGDRVFRMILGNEKQMLAPLLETFRMDMTVLPPINFSSPVIDAPRLQTISLSHISLLNSISFNPTSLRDITLNIGETQEILPSLHFLASCPNICVLKLIVDKSIDLPDIEGRPRIFFPCLDALSLEFHAMDNPCAFLRTIEAPALRKLWFTYEEDEEGPFVLATLESLCGHNPPLQELLISSVYLDDGPPLASMLGRMQNLRSLTLSNCTIDDYILEFLTPDAGSTASEWKCPSLTVLNISGSECSFDLFVRLVRSRVPTKPGGAVDGGRYLRCVDVSAVKDTDVSAVESDIDTENLGAFIYAMEDMSRNRDLQVVCSYRYWEN